jgi:amino acid adenylation domain-containing protein
VSVRLGTELKRDLWEKAITTVTQNSDITRSRFFLYEGEIFQFIDKSSCVHFEFIDLADVDADEGDIEEFIINKIKKRYDIYHGPVFRSYLVKDQYGEYIAILATHHLVCDAPGGKNFLERVGSIYESLANGRELGQSEPGSFYDCIEDIISRFDTKEIQQYWSKHFADVVPLELQLGSKEEVKRVVQKACVVGKELEEIKGYCVSNRCSVPAYFRALYSILLKRYFDTSGTFVVYNLINGRPKEHASTIGCFYQVLPMLFPGRLFEADTYILDYLHYVKDFRKNLNSMQDVSVFLQRRLLKQQKIRFYYNFYNFSTSKLLKSEKEFRMYDYYPENEFHFVVNDLGSRLELTVQYDEAYFSDANFLKRVLSLSYQVLHGARYMRELDILLEKERYQVLEEWNNSTSTYPQNQCIHQLFEDQVQRTPDAIALICNEEQLSYQELNRRANRLARLLVERGVGTEVLVAVLAERDSDLLIVILAIFKAGGAYLPLDPHHPTKQLYQVLNRSKTSLVLARGRFMPTLSQALIGVPSRYRPQVMQIENLLRQEQCVENLPLRCTASSLAYVIFTSGSTGVPKGVMIEHRGMLNHLFAKVHDLRLTETDSIAQTASQCFDISVWQFLAALLVGGHTHIFKDNVSHNPTQLLKRAERNGITILETVPSLLRAMLEEIAPLEPTRSSLMALRWLILTGEALSPKLTRLWLSHYPSIPLMNAYGPTECSDDVSHHFIFQPLKSYAIHTPIGRPIANMRLYILDCQLRPVPIGGTGELYISGIGVGRGYLHEPVQTVEAFIPNPFEQATGAGTRLYKTGDLARYLPNGTIEFLGRIDHQVKIHGFRIELGEIEAVLAQHPLVRESVVLAREDVSGDKRLVAYIAPNQGSNLIVRDLRSYLHSLLPSYMIPSAFLLMEDLPLMPTGKVDRIALPEYDSVRPELEVEYVAPCTPTEKILVDIWSKILDIDKVGIHDNFFELGGNSLLAVQLISKVREAFHMELPLRKLFLSPDISGLADAIEAT